MRQIKFGIIGCGLMGREFASAAARWCHISGLDVQPVITAVCDAAPAAADWFKQNVPSVKLVTTDYKALLDFKDVEAIYCAVPHNLHAQIYTDIIAAGKHLLGEKPFGIDLPANQQILASIKAHPKTLVRCSSEMPFIPGGYKIAAMVRDGKFGRIIEAEAGLWHSSDLNPLKPINWKRRIATNGEYGCMGDLGMHACHLPLRFGWKPIDVRAVLSKIVNQRPDGKGGMAPCETWDNATLLCRVNAAEGEFPLTLSTKRIAPGHNNTWFLRIIGTKMSAEFSTKDPKRLAVLPYEPGGEQAWHVTDVPCESAYKSITGGIFEFGFSDSILQMWGAFCDELAHGRSGMTQPLYCATPEEAAMSHVLFTAALESHKTGQTMPLKWE
jgi:predicted dehydrogenase